ncbi:MAG: hypothetical protein LBR80_05540 [Deltaproteobacteria bacterium]|nr:hypothetical protein [Deltaproteobacteria bacterium]
MSSRRKSEKRPELMEKASEPERLARSAPAGVAGLRGYCGLMGVRSGRGDDCRLPKDHAGDGDRLFMGWRGIGSPAARRAAPALSWTMPDRP